jgi:hypothetical protein
MRTVANVSALVGSKAGVGYNVKARQFRVLQGSLVEKTSQQKGQEYKGSHNQSKGSRLNVNDVFLWVAHFALS